MAPETIIGTARLRLRSWAQEDLRAFSRLARDPLVMRFIRGGEPASDEQVSLFIERQVRTQTERGWCRWALELISPGEGEEGLVGFTGFGCTFAPDVELGWWLRPDLWGRGLATEAAIAALGYGWGTIGFHEVISVIHPDNAASIRVATKAGLVHLGEQPYPGLRLLRFSATNPLADPPADPRFVRHCAGEEQGPSLGGQR